MGRLVNMSGGRTTRTTRTTRAPRKTFGGGNLIPERGGRVFDPCDDVRCPRGTFCDEDGFCVPATPRPKMPDPAG